MKTHSLSKIILIMCALLIFCGAFATTSRAATFFVTNPGDNGGVNPAPNAGTGTLRQAIVDANANAGADTITFAAGVTGTILLGSALPNLADDVTIAGPGANVLTVQRDPAASAFRIFAVNSGVTATISDLTISGGSVTGGTGPGNQGAGIFNVGMLTVTDCTISNNTATGNGGGIRNAGSLTVSGSTFTGNTSFGGGAINSSGPCSVSNSTISGNHSTGNGGGITINGDTTTVSNSTVTGNTAHNSGGGIFQIGTLNLNSSIVANNTSAISNGPDITGTVASGDYNLVRDTSNATLSGTHNITGVDPMLGPLAYYGGPTATHILKTGSPAIDAGDPNFTSPPSTDQRGFARVVNGRIDIGAFERQPNDIDPTLVVTTTADTNANNTCSGANACSLRDAITAANASAPDDAIYFAVTGTITLNTLNLPSLNSNMKILGPGANALTVKRDSAAPPAIRIFTINSGKTVTISGLTMTNGVAGGDSGEGGGIFNEGTLTLSNSALSGNSAGAYGGGIFNGGTVTINNNALSGNSAGLDGGAVFNGDGWTVTINNSTLSGNSAGFGGGIFNGGTLTIDNSTLSGNSAGGGGGGIYNSAGGSPTLSIGSTILKTGASGANIATNPNGTVTSLGYNLSSDGSGPNNGTTDQINTDPMLGPLQNNGGPTFTHAIDCGSPAVDRGKNFAGATTDQRGLGFARTVGTAAVAGGDGTDIGAFEIQTPCNTPPTITAATGVTRQQGAASSNSQIATVHDDQDPPTALAVTVNGSTSATANGVTVSNMAVANSGNVTADVVASCSASNASFTLRVTDTGGLFAEATLNVSVTASNPPVITLNPATVLGPNVNHSYRTFTISDMVQSATDDCDGNVINNVVIEKATSDETEHGPGIGADNTLNDIVIASDCKSVQLRAERDGTSDGRVYLVTLRVNDTSCNTTRATYKVTVPVGKAPAVDSGVHYTVTSSCTNTCP